MKRRWNTAWLTPWLERALVPVALVLFALAAAVLFGIGPFNPHQAEMLATQLIANGAVLLLNSLARAGRLRPLEAAVSILVNAPLVFLGGVDIYIAYCGFANSWPLVALVIPGALSIWASGWFGGSSGDDADAEGSEEPTGPDIEAPRPFETIREFAIIGFVYAVSWGAILFELALSVAWGRLLEGALIDHRDVAPAAMWDVLKSFVSTGPLVRIGVYPAFILVLMLGMGIWAALWQSWRKQREPIAELSRADATFIDRTLQETVDWLMQHRPRFAWAAMPGFLVFFFACIVAAPLLVALGQYEVVPVWVESHRVLHGWHFIDTSLGPSIVIALFAGMAVAVAINLYLARVFPAYAIALAGYRLEPKNAKRAQTVERFRNAVARMVRRGEISPLRRPEPREIVELQSREFRGLILWSAAALLAVTVFFVWRDYGSYTLLTDDHVEYADYWTGQRHAVPYAAVRSVTVQCQSIGNNKIDAGYEIDTGGKSISLAADPRELEDRVSVLLRVDSILRADGARFQRQVDGDCTQWVETLAPGAAKLFYAGTP